MQKVLIALLVVGLPIVGAGCTTKRIIQQAGPATDTPAAEPSEEEPAEDEEQATDPEKKEEDTKTPSNPAALGPEDTCLDGQDMDGADVDISKCPAVPSIPADAPLNKGKEKISLGAWEIGTTADGDTYKYGTLSSPATNPRMLNFEGGSVAVNKENLDCWAKGYYRLRKILQDAPAEYLALRKAGYQFRFFQFQTDLRNGPTGYSKISSFQDHLVKWVTVINAQGVCQQPTLTKFRDYAKGELTKRGIAQ